MKRRLPLNALRKIVVIKALHLGDLLLAVPALRALRAACPCAEITFIGLPWAEEFANRLRYVDRFIPFVGYPGVSEVDIDYPRLTEMLETARQYGYDLAVHLHGDGDVISLFVNDLGARVTAGYCPEAIRSNSLTYALPYEDGVPEVIRCLRLMELLGIPSCGTHLEFPLSAEDQGELDRITNGEIGRWQRPLVVVNPGARSPSRRWPVERFATVADELQKRMGGTVVVVGAPGEQYLAEGVVRLANVPIVNLAGKTTLWTLAVLIANANLLVSNDTGTAHLAAVFGTNSVTVFGPADVGRWAPLDRARHRIARHPVKCQPCLHWECPDDHICLKGVGPQEVIELGVELLSGQ